TKKDALAVRIDQSSKIPATTFLRALDKKYSTTDSIIREFYTVETIKTKELPNPHPPKGSAEKVNADAVRTAQAYYAAMPIIDAETGEELVKAGAQIGEALGKIVASGLKSLEVVTKVADPLILNT